MSSSTPIDLPNLNDIGGPEEAQAALNKLHANSAFRDAYYQDPNHPQHGDIHRRVVELHRIINDDQDPRPRVQAITEDAMTGQQEQREQRQQEAQTIADRLYEEGWLTSPEEMPEDLLPEELEVIKTRVLAVQGGLG